MRTNLKLFRVRHNLTQQAMAKKIGFDRNTYASIENGKRDGSMKFWKALQYSFFITDIELMELMKVDEE